MSLHTGGRGRGRRRRRRLSEEKSLPPARTQWLPEDQFLKLYSSRSQQTNPAAAPISDLIGYTKPTKPQCFRAKFRQFHEQGQDFYECKQCSFKWICETCAENCHKDHDGLEIWYRDFKPKKGAKCYCPKKKKCTIDNRVRTAEELKAEQVLIDRARLRTGDQAWMEMLTFLTPKDVRNVNCVSVHWYQISSSDYVWKYFYGQYWSTNDDAFCDEQETFLKLFGRPPYSRMRGRHRTWAGWQVDAKSAPVTISDISQLDPIVKANLYRCPIDPFVCVRGADASFDQLVSFAGGVYSLYFDPSIGPFPAIPDGRWKMAFQARREMTLQMAHADRYATSQMRIRSCGKVCQLKADLHEYATNGFPNHPGREDPWVNPPAAIKPQSQSRSSSTSFIDSNLFTVPSLASRSRFVLHFMDHINGIAEFAQKDTVRHAVHRYIQFMLMLAKESENGSTEGLLAPLDIEMVWQAHLIRTKSYATFCAKLCQYCHVGTDSNNETTDLIPHRIVEDADERRLGRERAQVRWDTYYQNSFEMDIDCLSLPTDSPLPVEIDIDLVSQRDIEALVQGAIKDRDWMDVLRSEYGKHDFMSDPEVLNLALKSYEKFLYLTVSDPDQHDAPGPTHPIDLIWHTHMMHPQQYVTDCVKLLGATLDHSPWPEVDDAQFEAFIDREFLQWRREYGHDQWVM